MAENQSKQSQDEDTIMGGTDEHTATTQQSTTTSTTDQAATSTAGSTQSGSGFARPTLNHRRSFITETASRLASAGVSKVPVRRDVRMRRRSSAKSLGKGSDGSDGKKSKDGGSGSGSAAGGSKAA
ncbi:hypothetical protein IAT38_004372 [Cryptococcus sp. DSM 104549]